MAADPASPYLYECAICKRVYDERSTTIWNKVIGWEKKRDAGGTNHVAMRRPQPEYRCGMCMQKLLEGDCAGQHALFG